MFIITFSVSHHTGDPKGEHGTFTETWGTLTTPLRVSHHAGDTGRIVNDPGGAVQEPGARLSSTSVCLIMQVIEEELYLNLGHVYHHPLFVSSCMGSNEIYIGILGTLIIPIKVSHHAGDSGRTVREPWAFFVSPSVCLMMQVIQEELYRNLGLACLCVFIVTLVLIAHIGTSILVFLCVIFTLVRAAFIATKSTF